MGNRKQAELVRIGENLIQNSDFVVDQRNNTSLTATGFIVDRWYYRDSGGTGTVQRYEITSGHSHTSGSQYYLRCDSTVGNNYQGLTISLENPERFCGQEMTVSFWMHHTTGSKTLEFQTQFLVYQTDNVTIDVNDAFFVRPLATNSGWTKYEYTFTVPNYMTELIGAGTRSQMKLQWIQSGSDTSTDPFQLNLSEPKLEFGDVVTPYQPPEPAASLQECQRFYWDSRSGSQDLLVGASAAAAFDRLYDSFVYPVEMRTNPTVTRTNVQLNNINTFAFERQSSRGFATQCRAQTAGVFYVVFRAQAYSELT